VQCHGKIELRWRALVEMSLYAPRSRKRLAFFHSSLAQKMHEEELQRGFMKKRKKLKKIKFKKLIHGMKQTQNQGNEESSKDKIYPDFLNLESKDSEEIKDTDRGHEPYVI
jgi:hypothetical protein